MNSVLDKIAIIFPDSAIKDLDIETQKTRIMGDFYYEYLKEFVVDIDNIKRVQLGQKDTYDGDMVPLINFTNSINALIPHNPLGLFDLIVPSTNVIVSKINFAFKYWHFCDTILNEIYELINPFVDAKSNIKKNIQDTNEIKASTNDIILKISHIAQLLEEEEARCKGAESANNELIDEKRAVDSRIEQAAVGNEMLIRKKQQSAIALKKIEERLESRKLLLDRSFDCDEQLKKMEEQLNEIHKEIKKTEEETEMEMKSQVEHSKLKECLAERSSSAKRIHKSFSTLKKLTEAKKLKEEKAKEIGKVSSLDEINERIKDQEEEIEKLLSDHSRKQQQIKNSIERKTKYENNKSKLQNLRGRFRDVTSSHNKLAELGERLEQITEAFINEENKLKQMREELVTDRMLTVNNYKDMTSSVTERLTKFRDGNLDKKN